MCRYSHGPQQQQLVGQFLNQLAAWPRSGLNFIGLEGWASHYPSLLNLSEAWSTPRVRYHQSPSHRCARNGEPLLLVMTRLRPHRRELAGRQLSSWDSGLLESCFAWIATVHGCDLVRDTGAVCSGNRSCPLIWRSRVLSGVVRHQWKEGIHLAASTIALCTMGIPYARPSRLVNTRPERLKPSGPLRERLSEVLAAWSDESPPRKEGSQSRHAGTFLSSMCTASESANHCQ
jgi:hypothetical protein